MKNDFFPENLEPHDFYVLLEMAARRVQFPQAPQDAPPNADRGDRQDAQQQADGQNVPRGDGNAQRVGQADGQNLPAPNVQAPPAQQPGPVQNADAQGGELEVNIVFICFCLHLRGFNIPDLRVPVVRVYCVLNCGRGSAEVFVG